MSEVIITDALAFKSVHATNYPGQCRKLTFVKDKTMPLTSCEIDTSEVIELLEQSAFEHLSTSLQLQAQKFACVALIVAIDYEALYAYKCGEYQRCLQLSTHNVRKMIGDDSTVLTAVFAHPVDG